MDPSAPVLDLAAARPQAWADEAPLPEIDLRLMAGELALVDARHAARPACLEIFAAGSFRSPRVGRQPNGSRITRTETQASGGSKEVSS